MLQETGENSDYVSIKGLRQGLLVALAGGDWESCVEALTARLNDNPQFFSGGKIALDFGSQHISQDQLREILDLLDQHQVQVWALLSQDPDTRRAAQDAGLAAAIETPQPQGSDAAASTAEFVATDGLMRRRTLRSGQSLRHPGHIVVIGDVNPGAEVIAGGDIVVWGRLKGVVHAGALGNEGAVICALDLSPTQLRIARYIARSPEEYPQETSPEMALVREGQIEAVPWPSRSADWAGVREK